MRTPLMPWQRMVADVGLERLPSGEWAYTIIIVTVPRQAGKTTVWHPIALHRCATRPLARTWFTAQTRQKARDHLVDKAGPRVETSPLKRIVKLRRSQGSEGFYFRNGSSYRVFAPHGEMEDLHGEANELVGTDEIWVWDELETAALRQAILPTFTTTGGQWWQFSTAGTANSFMLNAAVEQGRAAVEEGRREGVAYFEWSLSDEHAAQVEAGLLRGEGPEFELALQLLLDAHPGYGHTLKIAALRQAVEQMSVAEVLRAYGNRATRTGDQVIPADRWAADRWGSEQLAAGLPVPPWPKPSGPISLGFDVALGRTDAAITAQWRDDAGRLHVDVVDHRAGDEWVPAALDDLRSRWHPVAIGHDSVGPVVDIADRATRRGLQLTATTSGQLAASCEGVLGDIVDGRLVHPGHQVLDDAVANAAQRTLGEGWAWGRRKSAGSIAALVAITVGRWALDHALDEPAPAFRDLEE